MRGLRAVFWGVLLCAGVPGWSPAALAADDALTVQSLLAEQDEIVVRQAVIWNEKFLRMPQAQTLDPALREAVDQMADEQVRRLPSLIRRWIAEERAARQQPTLRGPELLLPLVRRSINEIAVAALESAGPAHDEVWLKAALAPQACELLSAVSPFARRIAMIQAAPADARPALLAAEKELLARWGLPREGLPARPSAAELMAAEHAVTRLRAGQPVAAAPMTPYLAAMVFARQRKTDLSERCAISQWWLQSQLAEGKVDRNRALAVYRYSMMLDVDVLVPKAYQPGSATAQAPDKPRYPRTAQFFQAEGVTTLKVGVDGQGKALLAEVVARQITVPGVRGNLPLAFEALFDDAAIGFALQRSYPPGKAGEQQFEVSWSLDKDDHEAR